MIAADTDVLIDYLAGSNPGFARVAAELEGGGLATTAVTRYELLAGASSARQEARVRDLLAALPLLPLDAAAADWAARARRELERRGEPIGMADCLIAGIVATRRARLLTRNRRHFERFEMLDLAEWRDG